ncbi:MAG: Calx-beta domain-containing protein [Pseudoxanthomonas sp.]
MEHGVKRLLALAVVLCAAQASQAQVVISQVYGGGGNSGAPLRSDFIELHNTSAQEVSVAGWSVQYASAAGTSWQRTELSGSIPAGGYYLVKQADGSNAAAPALPDPDATGTIAMSGTAGKVALVNNGTALSGACPTGNVDFIGFGSTASCAEGSAPTPNLSNTTAALRADAGCTDTNNNAADFTTGTPAPRNSATPANICGAAGQAVLTAADISQDEASGAFVFTFTLNQPAGAGGVRVDWTTADGTATAGSDYTAASGTLDIAEGQTSTTVSVSVIDDDITEADETFFLQLSNVVGAVLGRQQVQATIVNDDVSLTAIHAIQGSGSRSPMEGALVYTSGIVTGVKSAGFFLQARDADADADPATSEGIYVYTGSAPPAAAAVGNEVRVSGTVLEYVPSADPYQLSLTEIGGAPTVSLLSTGNALPAPIALTPDFPSANGGLEQLERLEGMRVNAASLTVVAPTGGNTNETSATGTSNGILHAVVTGVARPFREPGIEAPTPAPTGSSMPPIPQWDANPELFTLDSDSLGDAAYTLDLSVGAVITGYTGPLDYGFRRYTLHRDPAVAIQVTPGATPQAARPPTADEFTVAGYNLERFFDTTNDPAIGEPVLTAAAFERRLAKASLTVRDYLHLPDILATVEVENLSVLQTLATRINADAVAAGASDPQYVAYLEEGNDVGGIDVGFLVKTAAVASGVARVDVNAVTQHGKDFTWVQPDGQSSLLNDRPPLALDATVHYADGRTFPITVIAVHQRSLSGVETDDAAGERVRAKRQKQAEYLAGVIQQMQVADPERRISVLGDFNAFQFNDGYVDAMSVVMGTPTPDAQTAVAGDGIDLVDPDLVNLGTLEEESQQYSFVFDGNAQTLDHVLGNEALLLAATSFGLDHARINADFPEVARNDAASPSRLSDHDPVVAYFEFRHRADLAVTAAAVDPLARAGSPLRFTAQLRNLGPETAQFPGVGFALNGALPDMAVTAPAGWSCDTAQVSGGNTSVACAASSLAVDAVAAFSINATALTSQIGTQALLSVSASAQTFDPEPANDHATAALQVLGPIYTDLEVKLSGDATINTRAFSAEYTATVINRGNLGRAPNAWVRFSGNTMSALTVVIPPPRWICWPEGSLRNLSYVCMAPRVLDPGDGGTFRLRVPAKPTPASKVIEVKAEATTTVNEPDLTNNTAVFRTQVR